MRFTQAVQLLKDTANQAIILSSPYSKARVLVCPDLVGRVLTVCYGDDQDTPPWVNVPAIERGKTDPVFNNFGGAERFWFTPEGGTFGLNFAKRESKFENYCVPPAMSSQSYEVVDSRGDEVTLFARLELENNVGTRFEMEVHRRIEVLVSCPYSSGLEKVDFVGFASQIDVRNTGPFTWGQAGGGTLGMWCLSQLQEKPALVIVVPIVPGSRAESALRSDYFKDFCLGGQFPENRRWMGEDHALLKADGKARGKFGVGRNRATSRLASVDLESGELVIVDFDDYPEMPYINGYWRELEPAEYFDGDVAMVYIDGPEVEHGPAGQSYELETVSPAMFLHPGQSFSFRNRVYFLRGKTESLNSICERFLHTNFEHLKRFNDSTY